MLDHGLQLPVGRQTLIAESSHLVENPPTLHAGKLRFVKFKLK